MTEKQQGQRQSSNNNNGKSKDNRGSFNAFGAIAPEQFKVTTVGVPTVVIPRSQKRDRGHPAIAVAGGPSSEDFPDYSV